MQLRHLRYLDALARERHFGRAAQACEVSQPALSQALRQLEASVGAPLIDRRSQGFCGLTREGDQVLDWARRTLSGLDDLQQLFAGGDASLTGRLRLGTIPMASPMVARLTTSLHRLLPNVTMSVRSLNFTELERALERFEIDVGVTYLDVPRNAQLRPYVLYDEEYFLLAPAGHPVAASGAIPWREAAALPLCLLTPDMLNRQFIDRIFRDLGVPVRPVVETNCALSIFAHAKSGALFTIVPQTYVTLVRESLDDLCALRLVEPDIRNSMGFFIADRPHVPPITKAFVEVAQTLISAGRLF